MLRMVQPTTSNALFCWTGHSPVHLRLTSGSLLRALMGLMTYGQHDSRLGNQKTGEHFMQLGRAVQYSPTVRLPPSMGDTA